VQQKRYQGTQPRNNFPSSNHSHPFPYRRIALQHRNHKVHNRWLGIHLVARRNGFPSSSHCHIHCRKEFHSCYKVENTHCDTPFHQFRCSLPSLECSSLHILLPNNEDQLLHIRREQQKRYQGTQLRNNFPSNTHFHQHHYRTIALRYRKRKV